METIKITIDIIASKPGDNRRTLTKLVQAEHVSVVADAFREFLSDYVVPERSYDAKE